MVRIQPEQPDASTRNLFYYEWGGYIFTTSWNKVHVYKVRRGSKAVVVSRPHSTSILTRPAASAFGIANVNTPSTNLADTLFASTCVGRVMLRVNVVWPVDSRSTDILVDSGEAANRT